MEDRILEKLQAFHDTLGNDIKYLSDEEEVSAQKLFADLSAVPGEEEEEYNPELAYLAVIRQIRDNDPELFSIVKRLPKRAKAGKPHKDMPEDATISMIRKGGLKAFFIADMHEARQLSFIDAIKYIESDPDIPAVRVPGRYYTHLHLNDEAFDDMLLAEEEVTIEKVMVAGNDAKVIQLLKAISTDSRITDEQEGMVTKPV